MVRTSKVPFEQIQNKMKSYTTIRHQTELLFTKVNGTVTLLEPIISLMSNSLTSNLGIWALEKKEFLRRQLQPQKNNMSGRILMKILEGFVHVLVRKKGLKIDSRSIRDQYKLKQESSRFSIREMPQVQILMILMRTKKKQRRKRLIEDCTFTLKNSSKIQELERERTLMAKIRWENCRIIAKLTTTVVEFNVILLLFLHMIWIFCSFVSSLFYI